MNAATLQPLGRYGDGLIPYSSSTAPSPDSDGKSVWFLSYVGTGWAVLEFDRTTFQLRRTISLGSLAGDFGVSNATRLVRWSPTGFAFGTYDKLYLINLPN